MQPPQVTSGLRFRAIPRARTSRWLVKLAVLVLSFSILQFLLVGAFAAILAEHLPNWLEGLVGGVQCSTPMWGVLWSVISIKVQKRSRGKAGHCVLCGAQLRINNRDYCGFCGASQGRYCSDCGYDLSGNERGRCPECGAGLMSVDNHAL